MKKKLEIVSLVFSIIGMFFSVYFLFKMIQVWIFAYGMTYLAFIINVSLLILSVMFLLISMCIELYKRKTHNTRISIIITVIAGIVNVFNVLATYFYLN